MELNKAFLKAINVLFILVLTFVIISILDISFGISNNVYRGGGSIFSQILVHLFNFLPIIVFWLLIAYVTKDKRSALVVLGLLAVWEVFFTIQFRNSDPYLREGFIFSYWAVLIKNFVVYILFGLLHFKSLKGLWMLLIVFVILGLNFGSNPSGYFGMVENLLEDINVNLFRDIYIGNRPFMPINILHSFSFHIILLVKFIIFWFLYNLIKKGSKPDFSLRTIEAFSKLNLWSYSIIFWAFRFVMLGFAFGVASNIERVYYTVGTKSLSIQLIFFFISIYIVASYYRNFLTAFFVSYGKYPNWLYFLMNIPFIGFIGWILSLIILPANNISQESKSFETEKIENLRTKFVDNNKNIWLIVMIMIFLIIRLIGNLESIRYDAGNGGFLSPAIIVVLEVISMALVVFYYLKKNTVYGLLILNVLLIIVSFVFENRTLFDVFSVAGIVNLIVYYPLFHFDQIEFKSELEQSQKLHF